MSEKFEIRLCKKGQELLDAYKKLESQDEVINKRRYGKTFHNMKKYTALKKYVDHRKECNICWDSIQGEKNEIQSSK